MYRSASADLVQALDSFSLDVDSKEFVTLVGPSGCGKSTVREIRSYRKLTGEGFTLVGSDMERRRGAGPIRGKSAGLINWQEKNEQDLTRLYLIINPRTRSPTSMS